MPVSPTYPGVYIEEIPSGVRTITGVSTSIALFVGRAVQGPLNQPVLCLSYSDFVRAFSTDTRYGELPLSVRMFFDNGGTQCWVMRIAAGAHNAAVTLETEGSSPAASMVLTAKNAGLVGNTLRAAVTYDTLQPESTFNLQLFSWVTDSTGRLVKQSVESWPNLSMDPNAARYAINLVTQSSKLVKATVPSSGAATPAATGYSQAMLPLRVDTPANFKTDWDAAVKTGSATSRNQLRINVDSTTFVDVTIALPTLAGTSLNDDKGLVVNTLSNAIQNAGLPPGKQVTVSLVSGPTLGTASTVWLQLASNNGDVLVQPPADPTRDFASALMLGTAQGGIEVSKYAAMRPAPTGLSLATPAWLMDFAGAAQSSVTTVTVSGAPAPINVALVTSAASDPMIKDASGGFNGIREKLAIIAKAINGQTPPLAWQAAVWGSRLALIPTAGSDNYVGSLTLGAVTTAHTTANVQFYTLGPGGAGSYQGSPVSGDDGGDPTTQTYSDAYPIIDKNVDLFNLMVVPADYAKTAPDRKLLWGAASTFCTQRRAVLLMDPPDGWQTVQDATDLSTGVNSLRVGLSIDNAALFFPRLLITDQNGVKQTVGPAGAIAGLMARIDGSRGVWKAPAGVEADIRNILGLDIAFSNAENGVLNPRGINTLRTFPVGVVNWGARTMDGDDSFGSEWKYIPVRRLALFLEESLYRGTTWAVFEPNDEPLWAQIRLNIGAFMQTLFRQGAFQGKTPREAYFVKCDGETTTQDDINNGIVNVVVGFAPLKPAEFVIIQLQQIAGQLSA